MRCHDGVPSPNTPARFFQKTFWLRAISSWSNVFAEALACREWQWFQRESPVESPALVYSTCVLKVSRHEKGWMALKNERVPKAERTQSGIVILSQAALWIHGLLINGIAKSFGLIHFCSWGSRDLGLCSYRLDNRQEVAVYDCWKSIYTIRHVLPYWHCAGCSIWCLPSWMNASVVVAVCVSSSSHNKTPPWGIVAHRDALETRDDMRELGDHIGSVKAREGCLCPLIHQHQGLNLSWLAYRDL